MEKTNRIVLFWALTILGFLSHSLTDIMPAFWGENIAAMAPPASTGMISFMMCLTYTIPAIGILLVVYGGKKALLINAVLACIMAVFTILHLSELIEEFNAAQLFIMPFMTIIAILMATDSIKAYKEK